MIVIHTEKFNYKRIGSYCLTYWRSFFSTIIYGPRIWTNRLLVRTCALISWVIFKLTQKVKLIFFLIDLKLMDGIHIFNFDRFPLSLVSSKKQNNYMNGKMKKKIFLHSVESLIFYPNNNYKKLSRVGKKKSRLWRFFKKEEYCFFFLMAIIFLSFNVILIR